MKKYIKTYLKEAGYYHFDFIPCEICGKSKDDFHHIECKGMGGSPKNLLDGFENIMAVCREDHIFYGDKQIYKEFLKRRHAENFPGKLKYDEETGKIIRL